MAYVADGVSQFRTTGAYKVPAELFDLIKLTFAASLAVLTLSGMVAGRKKIEEADDDD